MHCLLLAFEVKYALYTNNIECYSKETLMVTFLDIYRAANASCSSISCILVDCLATAQ